MGLIRLLPRSGRRSDDTVVPDQEDVGVSEPDRVFDEPVIPEPIADEPVAADRRAGPVGKR